MQCLGIDKGEALYGLQNTNLTEKMELLWRKI